uniref:Uncharacterized protein n=1 Tax=Anguilla anguilla TaxID=7936 RepID=A0A0E9RB33_ANGAN
MCETVVMIFNVKQIMIRKRDQNEEAVICAIISQMDKGAPVTIYFRNRYLSSMKECKICRLPNK